MGPIHAEHYHFDCFDAVFGLDCGGGEGWLWGKEERESPVSSTAMFLITAHTAGSVPLLFQQQNKVRFNTLQTVVSGTKPGGHFMVAV